MSHIWSIAARELRGYFQSAVAVIFLATFLAVVMFTFFWVDKFFARNIADVRPLFDWLPILLIFLVAALTMRLWSEEHRSGTIEILLTMPVPIHRLVLGKFLAGLILVAIALALTLGLPISVSMMGSLDWGPVAGGYLAALLLAGAYLSIGLSISSATDNPIVALIGTVLVCGLLYLPGTEIVAGLVGVETGELLRRIGSGSRFESIARGVLDLRDLAYYGGVMALFLALNGLILQAKRWGKGEGTRMSRWNVRAAAVLVALNALALNVWMTPVAQARVDLTENRTYSLSSATRDVLRSLDEPLTIRGFFSARTHPLLAPLVPQIRDVLEEYRVAGGAKVQVEFVDPSTDEALESEIFEQYGIRTVPFQFADRRETSVVNAFFHILVTFGDQHEVLEVDDLIAVEGVAMNEIEVRLRNLEYDLTRSIRRVVHGFQSLDVLFATLPSEVELTAFITPDSLPENLADAPALISIVARELEEQSGGKLRYMEVEPTSPAEQRELHSRYGIQPYRASLFSDQHFYLHILVRVGDRLVRVPLPESLNESSLRDGITTALRRGAPGFTKVVGLVTPPREPPRQMMPQMPPQPVPSLTYNSLRETLSASYEVRPIQLHEDPMNEEPPVSRIPDDVDVLLLAGPRNLGEDARLAVDQYLMRGGAVIVMAGAYELDLQSQDLAVKKSSTGLEPLLERWGIGIEDVLVADKQSDSFPLPVIRNVGGMQIREVHRAPYPFFVLVDSEGMRDGGVATSGIGALITHWTSPISYEPPKADEESDHQPIEARVLLRSSADAWLHHGSDISPSRPDEQRGPPSDIPDDEKGPHVLAVALVGSFESAIAGDETAASSVEAPERLMARSPDDARLAVVGTTSFLSDQVLRVSEQAGSREVAGNLSFIENLVDWAVEDTALLSIRARGAPRTIRVEAEAQTRWEWINYGVALIGLLGVVLIGRIRRGGIDLEDRAEGSATGSRKES